MTQRTPPLAIQRPDAVGAPLTDAEFEQLAVTLDRCSPAAMNLETLDGFLTALSCGPDRVQPSEYLLQVWGEEPAFDDVDALNATLARVARYANAIAVALQRTLGAETPFEPRLRSDEAGRPVANDWALGFMRGVRLRPASWRSLMQGTEGGELLYPTLWLIHEHDADPALRPPAVSAQERDELVAQMIAAVPLIYRHFAPRRALAQSASATVRHAAPKPGRNDACPCGSGRKFKHCCDRAGETIH